MLFPNAHVEKQLRQQQQLWFHLAEANEHQSHTCIYA